MVGQPLLWWPVMRKMKNRESTEREIKSVCCGTCFFFISMVYFRLRLGHAYKSAKMSLRSCLGHAYFFTKSGSFHAYMLSYITLGLCLAYTQFVSNTTIIVG